MREIITMMQNDLRNTFAERGIWVNILIVPIIMTVIIGLAGGGGAATIYTVDLLIDPAAGAYAERFSDLLRKEGGTGFRICDLRQAQTQDEGCRLGEVAADADLKALAEERLRGSRSIGAVILPAGFTEALLAGQAVKVDLLGKGGLNAPQIVRQKVDAVLTRMNGAILAARVSVAQANPAESDRAAFYQQVYDAAEAIWAADPVKIDEQLANDTGNVAGGSGFGQSAPGMGAMFVLQTVLGIAVVLIQERTAGTMQRLLVLPVPKWKILAGKLLARFVLGLFVFTVLIVVGTFFGVQWGSWPAVIAIVLVYTLAATAMGLAFSTLVRTLGQAGGLTLLLTLTLAPLGGAWWPLDVVPAWMRTLGHISPIAWSQDAFQKLIFYGGTFVDILPQLGVLLLFAVGFFLFGLLRFKYE
jgi:ABC-2 type transport system permease protein